MAGVNLPVVLDTRDVDYARSLVANSYCEHQIEIDGAHQRFHAVQTEGTIGGVAVHRLSYGADLRIAATPLVGSVLVSTPLRGFLTVSSGREERRYGPGEVVAIGPDSPFRLRWEDGCALRTVQVDRALLDGAAAETGQQAARFEAHHIASRVDTEAWHRLGALLEAQASPAGAGLPPLLESRLEALVAATVFEQHAKREDDRDPGEVPPRQLRCAVEFVEANAAEPITTREIAAAANLSVRGLQAGLRRYLGTTPSELLRSVRLSRAHEDLLRADPASCTIADVAYRWGFGNPGRFTRYYQQRYGVLPSQELRR